MQITLMTDASVCSEYSIGTYGFWVVSSRGKEAGSGSFLEPTKDSNLGEMRAVLYSLSRAIVSGQIQTWDTVLVQLDNTNAIRFFNGNISEKRPKYFKGKKKVRLSDTAEFKKIISDFEALKVAYKLIINFRHVKGHSTMTGNRFAANNHCDARAKLALNAARRLHELKEKNQ